jgi:hypothetical protein
MFPHYRDNIIRRFMRSICKSQRDINAAQTYGRRYLDKNYDRVRFERSRSLSLLNELL